MIVMFRIGITYQLIQRNGNGGGGRIILGGQTRDVNIVKLFMMLRKNKLIRLINGGDIH